MKQKKMYMELLQERRQLKKASWMSSDRVVSGTSSSRLSYSALGARLRFLDSLIVRQHDQ